MKKKFYLITASGQDRPGMVAALTRVLFDVGSNIEDTSMTRLGGEFTMMLVAGLPPTVSSPRLLKAFKTVEKKFGLQVNVKPISTSLAHSDKQPPAQYMLSVYGSDKPGIVYKITQALAARRVSITDLNTKAVGRGEAALYVMLLEIQIPRTLDLDALRSELDDLKKNLQVEITLQDIEAIAL